MTVLAIFHGGPRDGWQETVDSPMPWFRFPEGRYHRVTDALVEPAVYQYAEDE